MAISLAITLFFLPRDKKLYPYLSLTIGESIHVEAVTDSRPHPSPLYWTGFIQRATSSGECLNEMVQDSSSTVLSSILDSTYNMATGNIYKERLGSGSSRRGFIASQADGS